MNPQPHQRRWFQFRLRTLLGLTAVICLALGWWCNTALKQRRAVEIIQKSRGWVHYDYEDKRVHQTPRGVPSGHPWLHSLLGIDCFENVTSAGLGEKFTDAELPSLQGLPKLQRLIARQSSITDAGIVHLKGLKGLVALDLNSTNFTDAGLSPLVQMTQLQELCLSETGITDAGLKRLRELPLLRDLDLSVTQITDDGLQNLQELPALRVLWLNSTKTTDAGLKHLGKLSQLQGLNLTDTKITDGGFVYLQDLSELDWLWLNYLENVTVEGLMPLQKLPKLRTLSVHRTINANLFRLQQALPGVVVSN